MGIEIICIGDELVEGLVPDRNTRILGALLFEVGLAPFRVSLVRDSEAAVEAALSYSIVRSELTILTGGLGATPDDITREVVAKVLDADLVENEHTLTELKSLLEARGLTYQDSLRKMAMFPEGAQTIRNRIGQARGFMIEQRGRWLYALPGVPDEVRIMAREECLEDWKNILGGPRDYLWEVIRTFGMAEFELAARIEKAVGRPEKIRVGYRAGRDGVDIALSMREPGRFGYAEFQQVKEQIEKSLGEVVYGRKDESLEAVVGKRLLENNLKIAVAESCSGGLLGDRLTDIPGSSRYFLYGAATYSNDAKVGLLNVPRELIEEFGAVSHQVAESMARNVRALAKADVAVSITGIAGPEGDTSQKPVGTVFIGLAMGDAVSHKHFLFHGERLNIKYKAVSHALDWVRTSLPMKSGVAYHA